MESVINPTRKIGIEIEVVVPIVGSGSGQDVQRLLAEVLTNEGIRAAHRAYSRQPIPAGCQFAIEYDASLQDESRYRGLGWAKIEAKTAPMTWEEVERIVPPALEVIRYIGARCNPSTGLHVHHHLPEARRHPQVVRSLQHLWWRFHPVMYGLVAPSRKSNQYCYAPDRIDVTQYDACTS